MVALAMLARKHGHKTTYHMGLIKVQYFNYHLWLLIALGRMLSTVLTARNETKEQKITDVSKARLLKAL